MLTRRSAIRAALLFALAESPSIASRPRLRIGMMDVILGYPSSPEAFAVAKRVGFDGIQVTIGKSIGPNRLVLSAGELQQRILRSSRDHHVAITSTYLDIMHRDCLHTSEIARTWVRESIAITKALDASMVELAFFFKCGLNTPSDIEGLVKALRELAPEAERERVVLGIENTLSAEDNARILDRVGSTNWTAFPRFVLIPRLDPTGSWIGFIAENGSLSVAEAVRKLSLDGTRLVDCE
jgi:L-ribulose-5-phosphate 3-epimerase